MQASKSVYADICICSGVEGASTNSYEDIHGDEEKQGTGGGHVKPSCFTRGGEHVVMVSI